MRMRIKTIAIDDDGHHPDGMLIKTAQPSPPPSPPPKSNPEEEHDDYHHDRRRPSGFFKLNDPALEDSLLVDLVLWRPLMFVCICIPGGRFCLSYVLSCLHSVRWWLAVPLQAKVIPRCCYSCYSCCNSTAIPLAVQQLSWGEFLLMLPLGAMVPVMLLTGFFDFHFIAMGMGRSGAYTTLAMWVAFWTANKSNSILTLLFGQTFEHLINVHLIVSVAALLMAIMHGVLCYQHWNDEIRPIPPHYGNKIGPSGDGIYTNDTNYFFYNETAARLIQEDPTLNETLPIWSFQRAIGVSYSKDSNNPNWIFFAFDGKWNWSGTACTLAFGLLVFSSLFRCIRRKWYTLWYWSHILACIVLLYFGWVHFKVSFFLFFTWGVDLVLRYIVLACCRYPNTAQMEPIITAGDGQVVCIHWPKTAAFSYNPGQFVRIAFPGMLRHSHPNKHGSCSSKEGLVYHPISIGSSPYEDTVRLYIRGLGPWSNQLMEMATAAAATTAVELSCKLSSSEEDLLDATKTSLNSDEETTANTSTLLTTNTSYGQQGRSKKLIRISLEGPYGSIGIRLDHSRIVMFISGGVGVAPCQSIALSLLMMRDQQQLLSQQQKQKQRSPLTKMYFCWSIRELELKEKVLAHDLYDNNVVHQDLLELEEAYNKEEDGKSSSIENGRHVQQQDDGPRQARLLETDIYHTQGPKLLGSQQETLTTTLHSGCRPDLDALFRKVQDKAYQLNVRRVAVVTCGPKQLTEQVRHSCDQYTSSRSSLYQIVGGGSCQRYQSVGAASGEGYCSFDLHQEEFEF